MVFVMLVCASKAGTEVQDKAPQRSENAWLQSPPPRYQIISTWAKRSRGFWMPHWVLPMNLSCGHGHSYLQRSHSESSDLPAALYILHIILSVKFSFGWMNLTHNSQATYQNRSEKSLAYKNHTSTSEKEASFPNIDAFCWQRCGWWQSFSCFSFKGHLLI